MIMPGCNMVQVYHPMKQEIFSSQPISGYILIVLLQALRNQFSKNIFCNLPLAIQEMNTGHLLSAINCMDQLDMEEGFNFFSFLQTPASSFRPMIFSYG